MSRNCISFVVSRYAEIGGGIVTRLICKIRNCLKIEELLGLYRIICEERKSYFKIKIEMLNISFSEFSYLDVLFHVVCLDERL